MAEQTPYNQKLSELRRRMMDAVALNVIDSKNKDIYEGTLLQIMNEAERHRKRCQELKANYERQVAQADAQSHAYTQVISIVYAVLNGFVAAAERAVEEEKVRAVDKAAANVPDEEVKAEVEKAISEHSDVEALSDEEKEALENLAKKQAKKKVVKKRTTTRKRR